MSDHSANTLVIGGGISGLSAAYFLHRQNRSFLLLESSATPGGVISSQQKQGFTLEQGPSSLARLNDETQKLLTHTGLDEKLITASSAAKNRFVLKNGSLHPVPTSFSAFLKTDLISWKAKCRLLKEPFVSPAGDPEESIANFIQRRLGRELLDYLINPFLAGIYAGKPSELNMKATFPSLWSMENQHNSLFRAMIHRLIQSFSGSESSSSDTDSGQDSPSIYTLPEGMEQLPHTLAQAFDANINYRSTVKKIVPANRQSSNTSTATSQNTYQVTWTERNGTSKTATFNQILIATPAYETANILSSLDTSLPSHLKEINYCPIGIVHTGFNQQVTNKQGFGYLIPRVEHKPVLGTLFHSCMFPDHAPSDGQIFTTFIGGSRNPELLQYADSKLIQHTRNVQQEVLDIDQTPDLTQVTRYETAIPQTTNQCRIAKNKIDHFEERFPGLHITGNFRSGVSVPDCIQFNHNLATQLDAPSD